MNMLKISDVCVVNPPKKIDLPGETLISFLPMEAVSTTGDVELDRNISVENVRNYSVFRDGDVLFAKITPCMENGKGAVVNGLTNGYGAGSTEFIVLRCDTDKILPEWMYYYLSQAIVRKNLQAKMTGSAGQKRVPPKVLGSQELWAPSIDRQRQIISRIEELLSQLDDGIETLKKCKAQLEIYRQAVLKSVFTNTTNKRSIREVSEFVTSGSRGWAKYYADAGARFVRITDLTRDGIYLKNDNKQFVLLPDNAEGKRSRLNENDVLVSITADLGSIALIPADIGEAYINQHIAMIRFNNPKQGELMAWYLKSDYGQKDLLKNKRGGGKLGLGLDDIRDTPVPILSDSEAESVLEEIDARLSVCYSIEKTVNDSVRGAEAMRQSILKEAFEGRL